VQNAPTVAEALVRPEESFASKEVKWLVAATSRDGRKGRLTPYADPRAYTDRLNHIFTASGWTREYTVHTLSPITRTRKDKPIQTGKVLVTCVVSIPGIGTHSGSGEEWADDENAMTSAERRVFAIPAKRAVYCRNCLTVSNSHPDRRGLCESEAVRRFQDRRRTDAPLRSTSTSWIRAAVSVFEMNQR